MLRYKDRDPKETVQIIEDFFKKKDLKIILKSNNQSEIGTWYCSLILEYDNEIICTSNGKGGTEIYSLASGYAELYERFCNLLNTVMRTFTVNKKFKEYNLQTKGYVYDPDEKLVSFNEAINASPRIYYSVEGLMDTKGAYQLFWETTFNNKFYAVPYKGINNNLTKFLVPEFVILTTGSDGMAAGNTLEEALVQGTSEVFEHFIWNNIYAPNQKHYLLDIEKLSLDDSLMQKIMIMKEKGYRLLLIDFSRTYNIPVLGLLTIDLDKHVSFLNLGAHPIFEVALERLLTETYQGRFSIHIDTKPLMFPSYNYSDVDAQLMQMTAITQRPIYNEDMFLINETVDSINYQVFLPEKQYTNKDFYNYYINLANTLGWNFYYRDWSLTDDFKAVHVYVDNIANLGYVATEKVKTIYDNKKTLIYKELTNLSTKVQDLINNFNFSSCRILDFIDERQSKGEKLCQKNVINLSPIDLYTSNKISFAKILLSLNNLDKLNLLYEQLLCGSFSNLVKEKLLHYNILLSYGLNSNKYTDEQISIIANYYGINYSLNDYLHKNDINYYLNEIFLKPSINEYHSDKFKKYIQILSEKV